MSPRDSLQLLRRRLPVVVVAVILGLVGGWVAPSGRSGGGPTFRATTTLLYEPQAQQGVNLDQVSLLATSGSVPSRVAARLNMSRGDVRSAVSAVSDPQVATVSITGRSADRARAVLLADVTAEELTVEIGGPAQAAYQGELRRLTEQVNAAKERLKNAKGPGPQAAAQNDVTVAETALQQYQQTKPPPKAPLRTLEEATATAVSEGGVKPPASRPLRALLLGALGLLAGIAGAFGLDRLDTKIRSKSSAERAFGAPVVAEVPVISKSSQGQLLTRTQPTSSFVEAYRGLRTYLALWAPEKGQDDGHRVLVVTSPSPGEGKTTTVAHLAAMLAEIGRSVVVVSGDLRKPRIHQYLGHPGSPGLVDVLAGTPGAPSFDDLDLSTSVRGVRLIPSGPPIENPVPLLEHAGDLLQAARGLADFVLVDTPPLLVANDAVDLARHADGVVLVSRAGKTPIEAAQRSAEQLARLGIPVAGVVLVASEAASTKSRYYSSRYYAEPERKGRRRSPSRSNGQHPAGESTPAEADPPPAANELVTRP